MFVHHLELALRSLKRHYVLTALIISAIALGIGASTTMLTVLHNLAGDPVPGRSHLLFHPQIDPRPAAMPGADQDPPDDLTYTDALNLYGMQGAPHRALMSTNWLPARVAGPGNALRMFTTRATTRDFFDMFGVPFLFGAPWSTQDDDRHAQVAVISRLLNDRLFGGANSVGRELVIATKLFRIVGVIDDWNPQPRFYDVNDGAYGDAEQMYLPFFTWLDLPQDYGYGPMRCWGSDPAAGTHDPKAAQCTWAQFWVQLDSASQVDAYRAVLRQYSQQQHELGRFERAPNVRLHNVSEWLDVKHVIPVTVRMQTWIAFGVLFICIVNTVGLLVAKFVRKSGEIGLRRALGASRRQIFAQCLVEAGVVGMAGGVIGLPLAWFGIRLIRQQPVAFAGSVHLDVAMLGASLVLSLIAAVCAGVWPAWRASCVVPALQVKSL